MYKLKIAVYGICKDEERNIQRWIDSATDADEIMIADTGSTDHSRDIIRKNLIRAPRLHIHPWRFDMAFNAALAMLSPEIDVCIPLGLDEVLEVGWREHLEKVWSPGVTKCYVTYNQHFPDGDLLTFQNDRPHARHGYIWKFPCHEQTYPYLLPNPLAVNAPDMVINHYQSRKDRSNYMALLHLGVQENPFNTRMLHYYGRELYYYKRYAEAIPYLLQYREMQMEDAHPVEYNNNEKILEECKAMSRAARIATLQQP